MYPDNGEPSADAQPADDSLADSRPAPAPGYRLEVLQRGRLGEELDARLAPALADGRVAAQELRGMPYVLNFWVSWCVPCRGEEAPILQADTVARRYGLAGIPETYFISARRGGGRPRGRRHHPEQLRAGMAAAAAGRPAAPAAGGDQRPTG